LAMELILSLSAGRAGPKGALCPTPLIVLATLKPNLPGRFPGDFPWLI
jgi:hypothetical protein